MSKTKKIVITLICLLSIVLGTGYFLGLAYFQTHFKIGTTINGFHCSFKSVDEVELLLSRSAESYAMAVETRNNGVEKIAADNVGLTFSGRQNLINIINNQDYTLWFIPEKEYRLPADCYQIDETKMKQEIAKLKCMKDMIKPQNAYIVETNGVYQVSPEIKGTSLDKEKTTQIIETAIKQWKPSVNLEEAGCYINNESLDEEKLQQSCDLLNSIKDTIITYDFGDRKETVDINKIQDTFLDDNFQLSGKCIREYIEELAQKYDTIGDEREFVTFDDKTISISGGDYGWKMDVNQTANNLLSLIKEETIDVVEPVYEQTAVSRNKNDIGHSYLEIDTTNRKAILYIDGSPTVQTDIFTNGSIQKGFYRIKTKQPTTENGLINSIMFGDSAVYQYDSTASQSFSGNEDISAIASNGVKEGCIAINNADMESIFKNINDTWPIVVY